MTSRATSGRRCILIAGGTCAGKSQLASAISDALGKDRCHVLSADWYYRSDATNFDNPSAIDLVRLDADVRTLLSGEPILVRVHETHVAATLSEHRHFSPAPLVVVEGLFVLFSERLRECSSLSVFVDVPADVRLARRIHRDVSVYGLSAVDVCSTYLGSVRPGHEKIVEPSRKWAELILGDMSADLMVRSVLDALPRA